MPKKRDERSAVIEGVIKNAWPDAIDLVPWRINGEPLASGMLRVKLPEGKEPAENSVVRIPVTKLIEVNNKDIAFGWVCDGKRPVKAIKDAELGAVAKERTKPRVYENRILGTMTLDRRYGWYLVERTNAGLAYEVMISVNDPDNLASATKALTAGAGAILSAEAKLSALTKSVIEKMHPLWLAKWRDGRHKYSEGDFGRSIKLASIHVQGARTTLHFRSGSLFSDHGIEARIKNGKIYQCSVS